MDAHGDGQANQPRPQDRSHQMSGHQNPPAHPMRFNGGLVPSQGYGVAMPGAYGWPPNMQGGQPAMMPGGSRMGMPPPAAVTPTAAAEKVKDALDKLDVHSRAATISLANRLPMMLGATVQLFNDNPRISHTEFKMRLESQVGPLPRGVHLPSDTLTELYKKFLGYSHVSPEGRAALDALERALGETHRPIMPPPPGGAWPGPLNDIMPAMRMPARHPTMLEIVCNTNRATFLLPQQTVHCHCAVCDRVAKEHNLDRLEMSPTEFERHSGMAASKKWKYTVRVVGDQNTTLGQWLDEHGIASRYTRSTKGINMAELPIAPGVTVVGTPPPLRSAPPSASSPYLPPDRTTVPPPLQQPARSPAKTAAAGARGGVRPVHLDGPVSSLPTSHQQRAELALLIGKGDPMPMRPPAAPTAAVLRPPMPQPVLRHPSAGDHLIPAATNAVSTLKRKPTSSPDNEPAPEPGREAPKPPPRHRKQDHPSPASEAGAAAPSQSAFRNQPSAGTMRRSPRGAPPAPHGPAQPRVSRDPRQRRDPLPGPAARKESTPEAPGLRSPSGKAWLSSPGAGRTSDPAQGTRVGPSYQARVPAYHGPPPPRVPPVWTRDGVQGPPEAEARASASGEAAQAMTLPKDAVEDVWIQPVRKRTRAEEPAQDSGSGGDAGEGEGINNAAGGGGDIGLRTQRQRKQPQWMKQMVDPSAVLNGSAVLNDSRLGREREEVSEAPGAKQAQQRRPGSSGSGFEMGPPPSKRPRVDLDALISQEVDAALENNNEPKISGWRVTDTNQLALNITLGNITFSGLLPANLPMTALTSPPPPPALATSSRERSVPAAPSPAEEWKEEQSPAAPPPRNPAAASLELCREPGTDPKAPPDEKHAASLAEYERMLLEGPPPGAKCAMCHSSEVDDIPEEARGQGGRCAAGLGQLMLIKASAITNAWVHDQCARWSPEAHDPKGDGYLAGVKEALRRGRMLRCKVCNERGATLGCLKKTCRASYHLSCARQHNCLLHIDPYVVACPEHVASLPNGGNRRRTNPNPRPRKPVEQKALPAPLAQQRSKSAAGLDALGQIAAQAL